MNSTFTRRMPGGTLWCISCARAGTQAPATCTVDDDPLCINCGPRFAQQTGCAMVQLKSTPATALTPIPIATPASSPAAPAVTRPTTIQEEIPLKLSPADISAIQSADDETSSADLARKYGVSDATISYHRKARTNKSTPVKKRAAKVVRELPSSEPDRNRSANAVDHILASFLETLTEDQCDKAWGVLPHRDKADAIRLLLGLRLETKG